MHLFGLIYMFGGSLFVAPFEVIAAIIGAFLR